MVLHAERGRVLDRDAARVQEAAHALGLGNICALRDFADRRTPIPRGAQTFGGTFTVSAADALEQTVGTGLVEMLGEDEARRGEEEV